MTAPGSAKGPIRAPLRAALLGPTIQVISEWNKAVCRQKDKINVVFIWTQVENEARAINQTFFNNEAECYFEKRSTTAVVEDRRHNPHGRQQADSPNKKRTLNALLNKDDSYDVIIVASPTSQQVRILELIIKFATKPICSLYPPSTASTAVGAILKKFFARKAIVDKAVVAAGITSDTGITSHTQLTSTTKDSSAVCSGADTTGKSENSTAVNDSSGTENKTMDTTSSTGAGGLAQQLGSADGGAALSYVPLPFQWFVLEPIRMESAFNKLHRMVAELRPVQGGEVSSSGNFLSSYNRGQDQLIVAPSPLKPSESGDLQRLCTVAISGLRRVLGDVVLANCTTARPNSNMTDLSLETMSGVLTFKGGETVTTSLTTAGSIDSFAVSLWGAKGKATLRWDATRKHFETQMHLNHFEYPARHKLSGHEWALASFVDSCLKDSVDTSTPQCSLIEAAVVEVMFQSNGVSIGLR